MPMPKAIVNMREEEALPTVCARESPIGNAESQHQPSGRDENVTDGNCCTTKKQLKSAVKQHQHPKKRKGSVKWSKDVGGKIEVSADDGLCCKPDSKKQCKHPGTTSEPQQQQQRLRECNRSPSPSTSLTLMELEHDIKKQEASIRRACELELKLLNQCSRVREKRSRMVRRLRKLKRSMQKLANVDKWTTSQFSFPPEYEATPKGGPIMIDMTKADVTEGGDLYEKRLL